MLRSGRRYPIRAAAGEQGPAQNRAGSILLRALIEPTPAPVCILPREERDLFIAAKDGDMGAAFHYLSMCRPGSLDTLRRLASGGSLRTRELDTDGDEALFEGCLPGHSPRASRMWSFA